MHIPNIFSYDWFYGRSFKSFTYNNDKLSIGWETNHAKKTYSNMLYSTCEIIEALNIYDNTSKKITDSDIINKFQLISRALGVKDFIDIYFDYTPFNTTGYTDGKSIHLSASHILEALSHKDEYNTPKMIYLMDVYIGLLIHELCHCLYTDFRFCEIQYNNNDVNSAIKEIWNIIEDEMIERKLGNSYPGYINFIGELKGFMFNPSEELVNSSYKEDDISQIMSLFFTCIRYPKHIALIKDKNILIKNEVLFTDIYNILDKYNIFNVENEHITKSSFRASKEIYDLLKKYYENNTDNNTNKDNAESNDKNNNELDSKLNGKIKDILNKLNSNMPVSTSESINMSDKMKIDSQIRTNIKLNQDNNNKENITNNTHFDHNEIETILERTYPIYRDKYIFNNVKIIR